MQSYQGLSCTLSKQLSAHLGCASYKIGLPPPVEAVPVLTAGLEDVRKLLATVVKMPGPRDPAAVAGALTGRPSWALVPSGIYQ